MPRPSEEPMPLGEGAPPKAAEGAAAPDSPAPPLVGKVISGRYRVERLLAMGGVSSVYLAQHVLMLKNVALKVLDANAEKLPEFVARFQREAVAGAHVQHPNIASATDFGQLEDGSYFLVQEYVPGVTLGRVIAEGPMPAARAANIARKLASAIGAAHDVGIVHRDIKPSNVILVSGTEDVVKLIDFGFAKVRLSDVPTLAPPPDEPVIPDKMLTAAGVVLGTVAYMAPEAAQGMAAVDQRSDLYALGLILYELLAGQHPFDGKDPVRLFLQQRTELPPPIVKRAPGAIVPPALEALVRRLLEKDPKDRFARASEVIAALDAAMLTAGLSSIPDAPGASPPAPSFEVAGSSDVEAARAEALIADDGAALADAIHDGAVRAPSIPSPDELRHTEASRNDGETRRNDSETHRNDGETHRSDGETARDPLLRLPIVGTWLAAIPDDSRFPRWSYVAFPLMGVGFIVVFALMLGRTNTPSQVILVEGAQLSASAAPVASAPREVPMEVDGLDAAGWRMNLRNAVRRKEWPAAADAVLTLLHLDPTVFRDHDVQNAMRNTAAMLEDAGGEPADKFFDTLSSKSGAEGLDLVYDIARYRSWTKAGKRATEILRRPDVMIAASPALKVVFDFREASCPGRRDLFARMAEQGDERALSELGQQQAADCGRRDPCCYKENRALALAIRSLKARLAAQPSPPVTPAPPTAPSLPAPTEGAGTNP